ncbi:hypothetical protein ILUMI_18606 [Ignelater luminosus]|uniref:Uncharacterized protein n=1 Tax=Ignelater luminosus TaxID=2038154 RepID=A0A8K0CLS1_IGNLU|nr:hypothetical protein ILUMI_18606 [Ignelater luminosus]
MTFERVEIVNFNKRYMKRLEAVTFKYNRTCAAVNATWILNINVGYNLNVVIQAYKFASNEYRLFPMRLQLNACEAINKDVAGLKGYFLQNQLITFCNWSPDQAHLPPFMPNGKYMLELQGLFKTSEIYLLRAYITIYRSIVFKIRLSLNVIKADRYCW